MRKKVLEPCVAKIAACVPAEKANVFMEVADEMEAYLDKKAKESTKGVQNDTTRTSIIVDTFRSVGTIAKEGRGSVADVGAPPAKH